MQACKQIKHTAHICSVLGCRKETGYWITNTAENNESEVCWPGHRTEKLKPSEDPSALHIYSVCVCSLSLPFSWRQNGMSNVFLCSVLARLYVLLLIIESMKYTLHLGWLGVYWVLFSCFFIFFNSRSGFSYYNYVFLPRYLQYFLQLRDGLEKWTHCASCQMHIWWSNCFQLRTDP